MKKFFTPLAAVLAFCIGALSQDPRPTPTPTPIDEDDVVKITTNLIQVDVTVTDRKGNVITDLRPEEIEILENGEKQKITNFSFVSSVRAVEPEPKKKEDKNAPILPPTAVRPEKVQRTIALVVDDLTLSFESTFYVREALKKFVSQQMQEGDLVAIIRTGAGIGALQQFTNDKRQLYAAIERVRWNPSGAGGIGAFAPLEARIDTGEDERESTPGERTPEGIERENNDFRESLFATGTLGAINYIVRGMQDLPGRKSVMLLSDGFSLFSRDASGSYQSSRILYSLRRLVDMANRAAVVIYTMDARGLQITGLTAADDTTGRSPAQLDEALSERRNRLIDTQDGLRYLAAQTGGISIINNNDLSGGIRKILDDQSYYLVGYEPDDATFDPRLRRFNKLEVRVTRPGTKVRYRSGFFGVSDEKIVRPPQTVGQRMLTALTSPFAVNALPIRLNALFFGTVKDGSSIRSLVHVKAQDLKFTDEPKGEKKAVFDVLAIAFGDNGVVVDQVAKTYTFEVTKEAYDRLMKSGFVYDFTFPIKKSGAYQLRVAIRDHGTDRVGSANQFVEVPNLKKKRLVLSGAVLENMSLKDYRDRIGGKQREDGSSVLTDTSLRQFKQGTVLLYGSTIHNAKAESGVAPNVTYQTRLFRDGKPIFEGSVQPVPFAGQPDPRSVNFSAGIQLGTEMQPGDYVLQITVTDNLAKEKRKTASQFVQFEIIE